MSKQLQSNLRVCFPGAQQKVIRKKTDGKGADLVIEATGSSKVVVPALQAAGHGGEVVLLGSTRQRVTIDVYSLIHHKGLTVRGAHASVIPSKADGMEEPPRTRLARRMLRLIERENLVVAPLISDVISPDQMEEAYHTLNERQSNALGVIVDWKTQ